MVGTSARKTDGALPARACVLAALTTAAVDLAAAVAADVADSDDDSDADSGAMVVLRPQRMLTFTTEPEPTEPGTGNPACVCVLEAGAPFPEDEEMAAAAEHIGAATAFVLPETAERKNTLRYFTVSGIELPFCGHATLAAASILLGERPKLELEAGTGATFVASRAADGKVALELGARPTAAHPLAPECALLRAVLVAFRLDPADVLHAATTDPAAAPVDMLVHVSKEGYAKVARPAPISFEGLRALPPAPGGSEAAGRVIALTTEAEAGGAAHFRSRCFTPTLGVDEDQACGAGHLMLGPYWDARKRGAEDGPLRMLGVQDSPRGAELSVEVSPDGKKVLLAGNAVPGRPETPPAALGGDPP